MRKFLILFLAISLLIGCKEKSDDEDNRLYLKEIKAKDKNVIWFFYSTIGSITADYVLMYDQKDKADTIVKSTNLKDVNFSENNIILVFYGKPRIYDKPIVLKKEINGFKIKIDTTAISTGPVFRKTYKKKNNGTVSN